MPWPTLLQRVAATALALLAVGWLFRAAPFVGVSEEAVSAETISGLSPVDPWAPVEVMLAGLPLESSSRPVANCLAAGRGIELETQCEGCRVLSQSMDGVTGSYLWLEPRPESEVEAWRMRAELLQCSSRDSTGQLYSYASLPAAGKTVAETRIVPLEEGSEEVLRVSHPGWSVTIDRLARPGVLEAVVLGMRLRNWSLIPASAEDNLPLELRMLRRGDELCLLSEQRDAGETYLMALVQRQT